MQQQQRHPIKLAIQIGLVVALWLLVGAVFMQRQNISDWWRLRGYEPPTEIVALAEATTMTDDARRLFYVYRPGLEQAATFNQNCTTNNEFTIILGCYVSNQGIYVFKVDDERLAGVEEVTAAHEMLHAAYGRLSTDEREKIDVQLAAVYKSMDNDRLRTTIEQYRENDPSVVPNELHSILGTELSTLTPELESYYGRYFTNRQKIVAYAEVYEKAFSDRKAQIDAYEAELKSLQNQVESRKAALDGVSDQLAVDYEYLESQRSSISPSLFNSLANTYNGQVASYNREVKAISELIDTYNTIYQEYEKVVIERQDLYEAIDSRPEALPTQ